MKTDTKRSFFVRHRTLVLIIGLILFLPPLSFIFQVSTGDVNFCGKWCPRMFFLWRQGMTGPQFLSGIQRSFMGVALMFSVILTTFFLGRYWCSFLCPVGGTTELGSKLIPGFLKINFNSIPAAPVRYGYFTVFVLAPFFGIGSICCSYCNFATVPRMFGAAFNRADLVYFFRVTGLVNLGMIVAFGFLAKGGRGYCNFFCPIGAIDAILNKIGDRFGKRVRILQHRCDHCNLCENICPTWAIETGSEPKIDQISCFSCRECEKVCPKEAIVYGKRPELPCPEKRRMEI